MHTSEGIFSTVSPALVKTIIGLGGGLLQSHLRHRESPKLFLGNSHLQMSLHAAVSP